MEGRCKRRRRREDDADNAEEEQEVNNKKLKNKRNVIRLIAGSSAEVLSFREFVEKYAPSLELTWIGDDDDDEEEGGDAARTKSNHDTTHSDDKSRILLRNTFVVPIEGCSIQPLTKVSKVRNHQSLSTLVDDVVWALIQRRERLRRLCKSDKQGGYSNVKNGSNLLCLGYQLGSDGLSYYSVASSKRAVGQPCQNLPAGVVRMTHINNNVDYCKTSDLFRLLHSRMGDDVLRMLLMNFYIFLPVQSLGISDDKDKHNNNCPSGNGNVGSTSRGNYMQLTGPPLQPKALQVDSATSPQNDSKRRNTMTNRKRRKKKNRSSSSKKQKTQQQQKPIIHNRCKNKDDSTTTQHMFSSSSSPPPLPNHDHPSAVISRNNLFYKDHFTPHVGLPSKHILNSKQLQPETLWNAMMADPLDSKNKEPTEQLHKQKKDKRWCGGIQICKDLLRRHKTCDYARLLERYCPLPEICRRRRRQQQQQQNEQLHTTEPPFPSPIAEASASYTPPSQATSFLRAVLRHVLPPDLLGGLSAQHNWNMLLDHHVDWFVKLRRYEVCANKNVMHGMRVSKICWLFPSSSSSSSSSSPSTNEGKKHKKVYPSEHRAAQHLLTRVLRWIFGQFIIPLLTTCFYMTDSEFSGRQVLYYRKPAWSIFRTLSMEKLLKEQYVELSARKAAQWLSRQQMGFSRLRLLPKETGVRPIAMLSKRSDVLLMNQKGNPSLSDHKGATDDDDNMDTLDGPASKKARSDHSLLSSTATARAAGQRSLLSSTMSTNRILNDAFSVLQYEYSRREDLFGAGVYGLHYFYPRYRRFIDQRKTNAAQSDGRNTCPIYFASVDIQHCYDNINQELLLDILKRILSEDDYVIQRYRVVYPFESLGRVFREQRCRVGPPEIFQPFYGAVNLLDERHDCVFVDGVNCSVTRKNLLLALLREHLTSHLVVTKGRYCDRYLLQKTGIPQGSILSSLLCNFYYGQVEKSLLPGLFPATSSTTNTTAGGVATAPLNNGTSGGVAAAPINNATRVPDADLLVRMVDDFMLITSNISTFETFLQTMYRGDPARGVKVNSDKSKVSTSVSFQTDDGKVCNLLPDDEDEHNSNNSSGNRHPKFFAWCGMLFDVATGEVRIDYSRFQNGRASDGITVDNVHHPGIGLTVAMKTFVRPRCMPILFDSVINSAATQQTNFYQLLVLAAVKTTGYIRSSCMMQNIDANLPFLVDCIRSTISYSMSLIVGRLNNQQLKGKGSQETPRIRVCLERSIAFWLGWRAFFDVYSLVPEFQGLTTLIHSRLLDESTSLVTHEVQMTAMEAKRAMQIERLL